jgi:hypothetical protein
LLLLLARPPLPAMPTVKQLQAELKKRGLETKGKKSELEARLAEHDAPKDAPPAAAADAPPAEKEAAPPPAAAEAPPAEKEAAAPAPAPNASASRKRKADEDPAQAAATKAAKTAPQPKKAAASRGKAPVTEFRQDAYGKHETHTQYAPPTPPPPLAHTQYTRPTPRLSLPWRSD